VLPLHLTSCLFLSFCFFPIGWNAARFSQFPWTRGTNWQLAVLSDLNGSKRSKGVAYVLWDSDSSLAYHADEGYMTML
jgi:hypothetical protein